MKDMNMGRQDKDADSDASAHVMNSMEGHMDMGPHMKMTALRPAKPGDSARAQQVADAARKAAEKYIDYHTALADGFKIFHPELPQKMYHFTNYGYAMEAAFRFNPEHPTSLLYEKHGDDYKLIGVMYTAPKRFEGRSTRRARPTQRGAVARARKLLHGSGRHDRRRRRCNLGRIRSLVCTGSITTQEACDAAGGTFHPVVFNWMVHVYPFEKDQASIWSVSASTATRTN